MVAAAAAAALPLRCGAVVPPEGDESKIYHDVADRQRDAAARLTQRVTTELSRDS